MLHHHIAAEQAVDVRLRDVGLRGSDRLVAHNGALLGQLGLLVGAHGLLVLGVLCGPSSLVGGLLAVLTRLIGLVGALLAMPGLAVFA